MKDGGFFVEDGPQTEPEAIHEAQVNQIVEKIMDDAMSRRRILTLQELCDVKHPAPRYEQFFPQISAYFYSIDGTLDGERLTGAMLAGHVILVFAISREAASEIAISGLLDTIKFSNEYAQSEDAYLDSQAAQAANSGIITSTGGRKVH